jgi:hypothetical protein
MPPLDRQALDMALTAELEPLSPPLPDPLLETVPSLFSTIEAAAKPTTNLEHLSHALDAIPEQSPLSLPEGLFPPDEDSPAEPPVMAKILPVSEPSSSEVDASGFEAETGRALLPTPSMELPEPPLMENEEPEPSVHVQPSTMEAEPEPSPVDALRTEETESQSSRGRRMAYLAVLALLLLGGGWWWLKMRPGSVAPSAPIAQPEPPKPEPSVPPPASSVTPEPAAPEASTPVPVKPTSPASVGTTLKERNEAMLRGDLDVVLRQGQAFLQEGPSSHWTIRLEIACMGETLKRAVEFFPAGQADLFVLPIALKDGRTCYQVFYGKFPSRKAADKQTTRLPQAFHEGGNRPRVFQIAEVPSKQ